MFSWFRRKSSLQSPTTATPSDAPGPTEQVEAVRGRIAFSNARADRDDSFDCVTSLRETLQRHGRTARVEGDRVLDEDAGLWLRPVLVDMQPIQNQRIRTCTRIDVAHPTAIPQLVFEFQHSNGRTTTESIEAGFDAWAGSDLVALVDATTDQTAACTHMVIESPPENDRPAVRRRVVLGPVAHFRERPPELQQEDNHPFCPCCLLTSSMIAFKHLLDSEGFFAIRLYATRGPDGSAGADCRVNGEDFKPGKEALQRYVSTWPQSGFEFRKQYVIIQRAP